MRTLLKVVRRFILGMLVLLVVAGGVLVWRGHELYRSALAHESIEEAVDRLRATTGLYLRRRTAPRVPRRRCGHRGPPLLRASRYRHHCYLPRRMNDLRTLSFAQGGSTITQQVAKNLFFTQEKRLDRKVAEVFMAFDLERSYTKREILELYVNSSYFGDGYTGIGQAAPGIWARPRGR